MTNLVSESDASLFVQEMQGVTPIQNEARVLLKSADAGQPGKAYRRAAAQFEEDTAECALSLVLKNPLAAGDWLMYQRNGIQSGVYKKLRTGNYPHEATLNLNRKTARQAREEILQFVADCQEMNIRSVLVYFGQGGSGTLLKSYLAQWLPELPPVQAFHTALKAHGGSAAVYVLLRKSEQKRMENRERHAARMGRAL